MIEKEYVYYYLDEQIPYSIWLTSDSEAIETVVFLGTVQIDRMPQWVAQSCPPRTAVVQGAPHWHAKEDGSDIPEYMFGYSVSVFENLKKHHQFDLLHVIADSQAVPGTILLFGQEENRRYLKEAVFLQPLGLTANVYRGTDEQRVDLFMKRIIKNSYQQLPTLLSDSRLRYNHRTLLKMTGLGNIKARAQYNSGLKHSSIDALKRLYAQNSQITIISGAKDRIFPPSEIKASLLAAGIDIPLIEVAGVPHSPLASRQGRKLLTQALSALGLN